MRACPDQRWSLGLHNLWFPHSLRHNQGVVHSVVELCQFVFLLLLRLTSMPLWMMPLSPSLLCSVPPSIGILAPIKITIEGPY